MTWTMRTGTLDMHDAVEGFDPLRGVARVLADSRGRVAGARVDQPGRRAGVPAPQRGLRADRVSGR